MNRHSDRLIVLSRRDVLELLTLPACIAAVERAFRLHAEGRTLGPGVLGVPAVDGGFHIKAAGLIGERSYFAAKTNANFPGNRRRSTCCRAHWRRRNRQAAHGYGGVALRHWLESGSRC